MSCYGLKRGALPLCSGMAGASFGMETCTRRLHSPEETLKTGTCNAPPRCIMLFFIVQWWHISSKQSCGQSTLPTSGLSSLQSLRLLLCILLICTKWTQAIGNLWFCYFQVSMYSSTDVQTDLYTHKPFARCSQAWKLSVCIKKSENWQRPNLAFPLTSSSTNFTVLSAITLKY